MRAVAIGGGHGTAVTLRALRQLTTQVTGVVSVADNGGSTGRLREMLDVAAVGDVRKCLSALAATSNVLAPVMEHRFSAGDLEGHAVGNLLLAGMIDATGDLEGSIRAVGALLDLTGAVIPASRTGVTLVARTDEGRTEGQIEVGAASGIGRIHTEPRDVTATDSALDAIRTADLVVIGPGSLYTSVLAACVVPGITGALSSSHGRRVYVANLFAQRPETEGYNLADHLNALERHGVGVDVVIADQRWDMARGEVGVPVVEADLRGTNGRVHDDAKLARALSLLVA